MPTKRPGISPAGRPGGGNAGPPPGALSSLSRRFHEGKWGRFTAAPRRLRGRQGGFSRVNGTHSGNWTSACGPAGGDNCTIVQSKEVTG